MPSRDKVFEVVGKHTAAGTWYLVGRDWSGKCLDLESLDSLLHQGLLSGSLHMAQCLTGPAKLLDSGLHLHIHND